MTTTPPRISVKQNYELFETYFDFRRETEPPAIFHRWAFIGCFAAWLGRNVWLPFGTQRVFPNHYIMFVGTPGSRKTTAINQATHIITEAGYETYAADKTTKEKFLIDLAGMDDDGGISKAIGKQDADEILGSIELLPALNEPREVFIVADEFNDYMGNGNIEFQSLLGRFWDWDKPIPYKHRLKNSKEVSVFQPTVSILSGNTPQNFALCFPQESIGQGFMSRLLLIHGEASGKKYSDPPVPNKYTNDRLVEEITRIKAMCVGPMSKTPGATSTLKMIYHSWKELPDARFSHYSTRRYTHLLKLCIVFAASRRSMEITEKDVIHANTVLTYAELNMPKAMGEVGLSKNSKAADKIMQYLYEAREPKNNQEIYKVVRGDLDKPDQLLDILRGLMHADKIHKVGGGVVKEGYLPKRDIISNRAMYIDQSYLKGYELP